MAPQRAGRDITKQMLRHRQMVLDQMDFKQKAEEKKMSMSKNIARLAVTAGLTAALSFGGVMAPVTMAFADGAAAPDNSITIKKNDSNGDVKYKAYQIFEADVVDEDGKADKVVSNVKWAFDDADTQKAIIDAINAYKENALTADAGPQDVADWLTANITGNTNKTVLKDTDLLNKIAGLVADKVDPTNPKDATNASFAAGTKVSFDKSGYYLFLTDASTLASDGSTTASKNTATSPIYAVVGAGDVVVTEKTSIPTVDKQIRDDTKGNTADNATTDDWKNVGDAWIGQVIDYKLTGTVAANIATYDKYQYVFQDHLSVGLDADLSSVAVTIGGTSIPLSSTAQSADGYTAVLTDTKDESNNVTGHDLTISFTDLKAAAKVAGATLNEKSEVVVTYKAKLTNKAEYTAAGNTNDVKLVYSNNPKIDGTGTSTSKRVTDHVFRLDVTKVEKDNQDQKLEATFKVKMTKEGNTPLATDKWLTITGGITDKEEDAGKFTTDKGTGRIYIPGLVAGTYEITECNTPAGYNTLAPFTITVAPTYNDDDGSLKSLVVTSNDTEMVTPSTTNDATIPVTIKNKKGSGLPLTGLNGVTFTWIAGGAVLCIGVAHLIRSRKQAEESEQE